jgi:hypothetical protein
MIDGGKAALAGDQDVDASEVYHLEREVGKLERLLVAKTTEV